MSAPTVVDRERIPFAVTAITAEAKERAARVLDSGWVTTGPEVAEFEREIAERVEARSAVAVASCTAAIEISLRALGLERGDPVLTSTMTFCGAVNAIVHAGLRPVLVDVNPETLMPDAETIAAAARRGGGAEAMVAIHFGGQPAPVEELAAAAHLPLDRVIEDAAHALGTWVGDRPVGAISAATCFSFYATKNLPIGEGGMITTNSDSLADLARRLRLHGMSRDAWKRYLPGAAWRYEVDALGLKANMTDVQAAIGRGQLPSFDAWQRRREEIVKAYDAGLAPVPGIVLPARPTTGRHAWHLYVIKVQQEFGLSRDEFIASLADAGIDCSVHFIPTHHHPYYRRLVAADGPAAFPNADAVFQQIVSLPFHQSLSDPQVERVCEAIRELAAKRPGPAVASVASERPGPAVASDESRGDGAGTSTADRNGGSRE